MLPLDANSLHKRVTIDNETARADNSNPVKISAEQARPRTVPTDVLGQRELDLLTGLDIACFSPQAAVPLTGSFRTMNSRIFELVLDHYGSKATA